MSDRYLRIAVVHYVAVSGASRDGSRPSGAAGRHREDDVGITLTRPA